METGDTNPPDPFMSTNGAMKFYRSIPLICYMDVTKLDYDFVQMFISCILIMIKLKAARHHNEY